MRETLEGVEYLMRTKGRRMEDMGRVNLFEEGERVPGFSSFTHALMAGLSCYG